MRNYPIKDGLDRTSTDGIFTIPNSLIVDLTVSSPNASNAVLFVSKIVNTSTYITVEISNSSTSTVVGVFTIIPSADYYADVVMTAAAASPGSTGLLTVGYTADMASLPSGEFYFNVTDTELLMRVFNPIAPGISSITFVDDTGNSIPLSGQITVYAHSNLQFNQTGSSNTIVLNAGEDLGLNKTCDSNGSPIKSINGVIPDSNGNINLVGDTCITTGTAQYAVVINDSCGAPCAGCSEIATLTTRLAGLESTLLNLRDYTTNLQTSLTQLNTLINYQGSNCE